MTLINELKQKVLNEEMIEKSEALKLYNEPLEELCEAANEIRKYFCGNKFDICTIVNAKSGKCSEDCKYCAQSAYYDTSCEEYPLISIDDMLSDAKYNQEKGVLRYSIVTSGKRLSKKEVEKVKKSVEQMKKETSIHICGSLGLLDREDYEGLYQSGMKRIHNNLESSMKNFENICTTHTFRDKVVSIEFAKNAGMEICSGGIFGVGEDIEDRIDLAISLRELQIKSIPINILNPIKGTPFENLSILSQDEIRRIIAVYRFILPDSYIRLAGGRGLLDDKGKSCFLSGANAMITGDMLTTSGISIDTDLNMISDLGCEVEKIG